jgi:anaerobic selenocysteine-containing dehydrogenase
MPDIRNASISSEVIKNGLCYMCTNSCRTRIHVRDGKAVQMEMVDTNVAAICPRWKAQLDFVYHPDRLKSPMKRIGEGLGVSFEPISWNEALDTVADKFQKIKTQYGPESVV